MDDIADLIAWLRSWLDVDDRLAHEAGDYLTFVDGPPTPAEAHMARWSPERTLDLTGAVRRVLALAEFTDEVKDYEAGYDQALADTIRELATAWAHLPGYRDEWRPRAS